jgi:flavin-binding protein dodecin
MKAYMLTAGIRLASWGGGHMTDRLDTNAVKIIEIVGVSQNSFDDALAQAVSKAAESINGISSVEVIRQTASIRDTKIVRYEITVKLSFVVK